MSYYFSSLVWHAASFGQLLAAAVAAYWIAKGFRRLLFPALGRSASRLRLSSAIMGLAAFLSLVVASSFFMDRSFAAHLAQTGLAGEGRAGCASSCGDGRPDSNTESSAEPGGLGI